MVLDGYTDQAQTSSRQCRPRNQDAIFVMEGSNDAHHPTTSATPVSEANPTTTTTSPNETWGAPVGALVGATTGVALTARHAWLSRQHPPNEAQQPRRPRVVFTSLRMTPPNHSSRTTTTRNFVKTCQQR